MVLAGEFVEELSGRGYSWCSGVPCSVLKPFINYIIDTPQLSYVGASSEGEALGINFGAYLGGEKTVSICQNSGLGNMVNPLTSLNFPFRVPTLLITTWRGQPGKKAEPQHELMGAITPDLLETMQIPYSILPEKKDDINRVLNEAEDYMEKEQRPYGIIMPKGAVEPYELKSNFKPELVGTESEVYDAALPAERLSRTEMLEVVLGELEGDEVLIGTTGKTGRELFEITDRERNIYMVGSMGCASAIGLGLALARPDLKVVVLDGDGAALLKLGNLATIGGQGPENFKHIILDNESHDSTGGQATVSSVVRFDEIAAGCNYRKTFYASRKKDLQNTVRNLIAGSGPGLLQAKIKGGSPSDLGRPNLHPIEVKKRLMDSLGRSNFSG